MITRSVVDVCLLSGALSCLLITLSTVLDPTWAAPTALDQCLTHTVAPDPNSLANFSTVLALYLSLTPTAVLDPRNLASFSMLLVLSWSLTLTKSLDPSFLQALLVVLVQFVSLGVTLCLFIQLVMRVSRSLFAQPTANNHRVPLRAICLYCF
jgi:hypothetical protein